MEDFLSNRPVPAKAVVGSGDLYALDHRTGIGIEPDRLTAEESMLYSASFLALKSHVCLYAEVVLPASASAEVLACLNPLAFGGEGRRVQVTVLNKPLEAPGARQRGKPLLVLTTPGLFQAGWRPSPERCPGVVAAAVPGARPVSGWDLATGGPKPTRFAALAGSVYFFDQLPDNLPLESLCDDQDARLGYGCFLKGVWTDA
jgi:CRISPR-associated protein Cmr3